MACRGSLTAELNRPAPMHELPLTPYGQGNCFGHDDIALHYIKYCTYSYIPQGKTLLGRGDVGTNRLLQHTTKPRARARSAPSFSSKPSVLRQGSRRPTTYSSRICTCTYLLSKGDVESTLPATEVERFARPRYVPTCPGRTAWRCLDSRCRHLHTYMICLDWLLPRPTLSSAWSPRALHRTVHPSTSPVRPLRWFFRTCQSPTRATSGSQPASMTQHPRPGTWVPSVPTARGQVHTCCAVYLNLAPNLLSPHHSRTSLLY